MMNYSFTEEELEALKYYKDMQYEAINQLLVSNCETDIALLSDEVENRVVPISYDRETVQKNLQVIKLIYELMQKAYYKNKQTEGWAFARGTNIAEIELLKNELYIDKFLSTTSDSNKAEKEYSAVWNRPAIMYICGNSNIPYIKVNEILGRNNDNAEAIISPFTRIREISEGDEINFDDSVKIIKTYNVKLEKQDLEVLSEGERIGLYHYILDNADSVNRRLYDCIDLEKENAINYENMRKLEQLLAKYESITEQKEIDRDYTDSERRADLDDIERIVKELNELKEVSSELYRIRKSNIDFVTNWKKNIAVYLMSECKEIELKYSALAEIIEEENQKEQESAEQVNDSGEILEKDNFSENIETENNVLENAALENIAETVISENIEEKVENIDLKENKEESRIEEYKEELKEEIKTFEDRNYEETYEIVKKECEENIEVSEKLLKDIEKLISKQQSYAKIAGNLGTNYSALSNAFEMKKNAETLIDLMKTINLKVTSINEQENRLEQVDKLKSISKVNIQTSTLINYLNNPKMATKNTKINRFEEVTIIEENELKRGIATRIREICGEAELKKLKDDLELLEDKGGLSRFVGIFTGRNKLDDFMIEQIGVRKDAIRRTLSKKMTLTNSYSIHELIAEIRMFIKDNDEDELVEEYVGDLEALEEELKRNFVIINSKVKDIIEQKEGKNLPITDKKLSKMELIEIETYQFLHKYGYDIIEKEKEPSYQNTIASEIQKINEYINTSNILDL